MPALTPLERPLPHAVHVWFVMLDQIPQPDRDELSADEWQRAERFMMLRVKDHFIKARAALRRILGRYLRCKTSSLQFSYRDRGKPFLKDETLRFNLSHSGGAMLLAVTENTEVGIDIETIEANRDVESLAHRYFSPAEVAELMSLSPADRLRGFYNSWARNEAFIRARGDGLAFPLDCFTVRLSPHEPAALLDVAADPPELQRWRLHAIDVGPQWSAAVVTDVRAIKIERFEI